MIFTGSIELIAITEASQITSNMVLTGAAAQVYDENGKCYPDWQTETSMRPQFKPVSYDSAGGSTPMPYVTGMDNQSWYYNGAKINWILISGTTYKDDITGGCFNLSLADPAHPVVTIVKNLATMQLSGGNDDNLAFEGLVMGDAASIPIRVDKDIRISKMASGTAASIQIMLSHDTFDGDDNTNDAITAEAYIIVEGSAGTSIPSGYTVAVTAEGIENAGGHTLPTNYTGKFSIYADQVGSKGALMFTLKNSQGTAIAWASESISDPADAVQPLVEAQVSGGGRKIAKSVFKGEVITLTSKAMSRDGSTDRSGDYTAEWTARDGAGSDVTTGVLAGTGTQSKTSPFNATAQTDYDKLVRYSGVRIYCKWRSKS